MANEARNAELAINHLISNKREWNSCFVKIAPEILDKSSIICSWESKASRKRVVRKYPDCSFGVTAALVTRN